MSACDQETISTAVPEILLMEAAARGTAEYAVEIINKEFADCSISPNKLKITILIGKGNNGGDGLAAARILKNWGYDPLIILACAQSDLTGINQENLALAKYYDLLIKEFSQISAENFSEIIQSSNLIIDALLGTGIKGKLRGNFKQIIALINKNRTKQNQQLLAVDIPSGINGFDGSIAGQALQADYTATMAAYKRGLLLYPGRDYSGQIKIIEIGIKPTTIKQKSDGLQLFTENDALKLLPRRRNDGHKGSFGKVGILAGSVGMTGAAYFSSRAAIKTGSGLVYLLTTAEVEQTVASQLPEIVGHILKAKSGHIAETALTDILEFSSQLDVLAVGPGLGQSKAIKEIITALLKNLKLPLIIDADGINAITDLNDLRDYQGELLLTPHPGEFAHLIGKDIADIEKQRIEIARNFASQYNLNLILKGAATVIAGKNQTAFLNQTGCNGMATAGSGDVLTGIVTALIGQGVSVFEAAALAVYLHGRAGENSALKLSDFSLTASNIIDNLGSLFKKLEIESC
jgi:NAD(P)H-hydrate epimerase